MYFCDHGTTYRIKVMLEYSVNEHSVGAHHRLESYPTVRSIVMTPFRGSYNNVHADIKIRAFPKVVLQDVDWTPITLICCRPAASPSA